MTALPCVGRSALFDLVLFNDEAPADERAAARAEAAGLCARCPSPCPEKVTADTAPRHLVLLDDDWMPPAAEGKPEPQVPAARTWSADRRAGAAVTVGHGYVRPHQRPAAWARMAADLAARGRTLAEIAASLCVSEDTAAALLGAVPVERRAA